jgi:Icc-related predicted phosphoesterase
MKITAISDTHRQLPKIKTEGDIFIHAGDFSLVPMGLQHDTNFLLQEFVPFLDWLKEIKKRYKHVLFTPGNHDFMFLNKHQIAASMMLNAGITWLKTSSQPVLVEGLRFIGCSETPLFRGWAFETDTGMRKEFWESVEEADVIVSHGPPFGILDYIPHTKRRVGCRYLADAVRRLKPKLVVCGHIHEGWGEMTAEGTHYINASYLNERYDYAIPNKIFNFELKECP